MSVSAKDVNDIFPEAHVSGVPLAEGPLMGAPHSPVYAIIPTGSGSYAVFDVTSTDLGRIDTAIDDVIRIARMVAENIGPQAAGLTPPAAPAQPVPVSSSSVPFCSEHFVPFRKNEKNGEVWYSHKTEAGSWCRQGSKR